jgi:hypothetical protein
MIHELKLFSAMTKDLYREMDVRWTRRQLSFDTVLCSIMPLYRAFVLPLKEEAEERR